MSYKVYLNPKTNTNDAVKTKNILRLFKLIDEYRWNSLMFRRMDLLVPESDTILHLNMKHYDKHIIFILSLGKRPKTNH